jgi:hypothetical protein
MQTIVGGATAIKVSWSAVPGATSYTLERREAGCSFDEETQCCESAPWAVINTGLTGHKVTDVIEGAFDYRVTAVAATGSSPHPVSQGPDNCFPFDPSFGFGGSTTFHLRTQVPVLAVTPPMRFDANGDVGAPAGTNSTSAPPSKGRARLDFELAVPATLRVWAETIAPTKGQDSFWVRMSDGAWINWNNIDERCEDVHDSNKSGQPTVLFKLPAGSHRIEWAYREGGAKLSDNIILAEDPNGSLGEQCSD